MELNIDLSILEVESAGEYHARADHFLSSHQLLDFIKCPWLHRKKSIGLVKESDSASYLIGRAAHVRILEGRDAYETAFALGGPVNPKTASRSVRARRPLPNGPNRGVSRYSPTTRWT